MHAGGRFFWVGQHARPSDSTESSNSTSLLARALVSQHSVQNLPAQPTSACAVQLLDQQTSGECLGLAPQDSSPGFPEAQHWSLVEGLQLGSPGQAETLTPCLQNPRACLDSTSGFGPSMSTAGVDTWPTDYSPENVDQLLDWAADPKLQSSLSKSERNTAAFSMCDSLDTGYNLQSPSSQGMQALNEKLSCSPDAGFSLEPPSSQDMQGLAGTQSCSPNTSFGLQLASSQGRQSLDRQLSCSWGTEASHLDMQGCFQHTNQQAEAYSDGLLACALLPGFGAFGGAASQPLSASSELMTVQSLGHASESSGDPLDQLMESACCPVLEETNQQTSPVSTLHGRGYSLVCHDGKQAGFLEDKQAPQKKRCGRPRVYDLDSPLAAGIAHNALTACDKLRGLLSDVMVMR